MDYEKNKTLAILKQMVADGKITQADAFVDKAKKWFEKQNEWLDLNGNRHCDMDSFEDFVNYMKGE